MAVNDNIAVLQNIKQQKYTLLATAQQTCVALEDDFEQLAVEAVLPYPIEAHCKFLGVNNNETLRFRLNFWVVDNEEYENSDYGIMHGKIFAAIGQYLKIDDIRTGFPSFSEDNVLNPAYIEFVGSTF